MSSSRKNMNIFTNRFNQPKVETDWTKDFLYSISTTGGESTIKPFIGDNTTAKEILEFSFGQPKIKRSLEKRFRLISSLPEILSVFDAKEIKCCLCNSVIHFDKPTWYYTIRYTAKHFYYFVCSDSSSPSLVNCKCYRRI
jgi:hypothetical protein